MSTPSIWPPFVDGIVATEEKRRDSIESRGSSTITVSGALVALLVAIGGLAAKSSSFVIPEPARPPLWIATIAFVLSAVLALATFSPQRMKMTDLRELANRLPAYMSAGPEFAEKKIMATRLQQASILQGANNWKARALLCSVAVQIVAVGALAYAMLELV